MRRIPLTSRVERALTLTFAGEGTLLWSVVKHGAKLGASTIAGPTLTLTPRKVRVAGSAIVAPRVRRLCAWK